MPREHVSVFEVAPRDGFQNEPRPISFKQKVDFIHGLIDSGIRDIELGAFVRLDRVPQMADTDRLYRHFVPKQLKGVRAWSLVPNQRGLDRAMKDGARHIAVFTAATDTFAKKNIGMTVRESLREFSGVVRRAQKNGISVRGYVSTVFGCPFEGKVSPLKALRVIEKLGDLGVEQVSVGDTIGVATPGSVTAVMGPALKMLGVKRIAGHFHDTRGTALANALRSLDLGVRTLDSSAGGLGGCPFAPGASGNLSTEDLLYMLDGLGFHTGVDLAKLSQASLRLARRIRRPLTSRYLQTV